MLSKCLTAHKRLLLALVLLGSWGCLPSLTYAGNLSGEVELGYAKYTAETNGAEAIDASSFRQRYSLIYKTQATLAGGRLGGYRLALGYEWLAFNTKIKDSGASPATEDSLSIKSGHILYNGEIIIDPTQLPIKVRLYSRDLSRGMFQADGVVPLAGGEHLLSPGITTTLINGTHISTGISMDIGMKQTMTNNDSLFARLPRFQLDYNEEIVRDLKSITPTDTKRKNLSLVSLNKKDNWFHIRSTQYDDFIHPTQNYTQTRLLLGSVDPYMQRKWTDFTNWIKMSADVQFTKTKDSTGRSEAYEANLFAIASRKSWGASSFNSFSRTVENDAIRYESRVPLYINGSWGMDTDWRLRLSADQTKHSPFRNQQFNALVIDTADYLASLRVDTFKRSLFTLSPSASLELYDNSNTGKTFVSQARIETASTRRFSSKYGLFASYGLTSVFNDFKATTSSSLSQEILGKVTYSPTSSFRMELQENVVVASGTNTNILATTVGQPQVNTNDTFLTPTEGYVRYQTTAGANWEPLARLRIAANIFNDVLQVTGKPIDQKSTYTGRIDYTQKTLLVRLNAAYTTTTLAGFDSSSISGGGHMSYTPNRDMDASLSYDYTLNDEPSGSTFSRATLNQQTNYYLYSRVGVTRRILVLNETLQYIKEDYSRAANGSRSSKSLALGVQYFPLSKLFLAARAQYSLVEPDNVDRIIYNGSAGFNYQKIQASIDYSYGKESGTGTRMEKRFEATMKKMF
jgi:hypothetical protein